MNHTGCDWSLAVLTPMSRWGQARKVAYAWGNADVNTLQEASRITDNVNIVHVHINDLLASFKRGVG
jgi:hypothetical protein